jgi:hypothetical protein
LDLIVVDLGKKKNLPYLMVHYLSRKSSVYGSVTNASILYNPLKMQQEPRKMHVENWHDRKQKIMFQMQLLVPIWSN